MMLMSGCCLVHDWKDATCDTPKTCKTCGKTEGEALGHDFYDATCVLPKTCKVCGMETGEPLGHSFKEATCQVLKTCTVCGYSEGEYADHVWREATCLRPMKCEICGATQGTTKSHTWVAASYNSSRYCAACGIVEGDVLETAFEKRDYRYTLDKGSSFDYTTIANADDKPVNAKAKITDYRKYKSDANHSPREGYEWREVSVEFESETGIKVLFGYTDTFAGLEDYATSDFITYADGTKLPIIAEQTFRYEWKDVTDSDSDKSDNDTASDTEGQDENTSENTTNSSSADNKKEVCISYGTLAVQVPDDYEDLVFYISNADYARTHKVDPNIRFMEMK